MKNPTPTYSSKAAHTERSADTAATPSILRKAPILRLSLELSKSMKKPCNKTLRLLDRALKLLIPFESSKAAVTSPAERQDLLTLLRTHRLSLSPYIDTDRIESNLRHSPE